MTTIKHYTASWCGPCKVLKPIMQELAAQNPNVNYQLIDVDQNPSDAQVNGIRSVPVVIIQKNGVETSRFIGVQPKAVYERALK
jgi:thioredoxin 1